MRDLESFKITSLYQTHQWPPVGAPTNLRQEDPWKSQFNDPVNAVSFGFIATAILISMFIIMAVVEMLIRTTTTTTTTNSDSSPKIGVYSKGVSVLMPGDNVPTFIAHHAPVPAPTNRNPNTRSSSSNSIQEC